jgi:uncharacterized protein YjdB
VPDAARDASIDATNDPTTDPGVDAGCTSDNQCGPLTPHCNTNTGACVSRVAVAVTPANPSIAAGSTQQFAATMTYSDTSTGDVTALATWASSIPTIASVNPGTPGLATGVAQGVTTISATFAGLAGGTQLTVTVATLTTIQVTPPNPTNALGTTRQFTATGTYSDNSTQDLTASLAWTSSSVGVASVSPGGLVTATAPGTTNVSASVGGNTGTAGLHVSPLRLVTVRPLLSIMRTGGARALTATGRFANGVTATINDQVTWSSTNPGVAGVSPQGVVTSGAPGVTIIVARFGSSFSIPALVLVL